MLRENRSLLFKLESPRFYKKILEALEPCGIQCILFLHHTMLQMQNMSTATDDQLIIMGDDKRCLSHFLYRHKFIGHFFHVL